ncbi:type VI secretion system tip protein VgrG [Ralstonia pseudosolanacearum]|uniref:type VI secretion system Vgr family protein n=1 Tax=Ralstonia pseudosolanacearum TaxID=1310165 RepID=UPI0020057B17|nr:type VI secretion system Vgr family protein [Ralstonia pseudosolanacearum]MCK4140394.1 type VI secretion system tip protein VgrG [Ralstonia pseudosolanacearum]
MSLVNKLFQPNRTLSVQSAAIPEIYGKPALVPVRLSGTETIGALGDGYTLELKTPDGMNPVSLSQLGEFKLNAMVGHEITVCIELDGMGAEFVGAGKREITGIISQARYLRGEGRSQLYAVTIQPWPYLMTLTKNYRAFQNKALQDILGDIFAAYPYPVEMRLKPENFPVRDYQVQFGQSDFEYFQYLTQEFGVTWHMEYAEGRQRLVLCDGLLGHQMQPSPAYQALRFYRDGLRIDAEHIERFELVDRLTSGEWRTDDYDYTRSGARLAREHHDPRETAENSRKVYEWPGDYSQPKAGTRTDQDPWDEGERLARVRMQQLRSEGSRAHGAGNLRAVVPGYVFALHDHPHAAANREYLVLGATLDLEEVAEESGQNQQWRCRVEFEAHPVDEPYRPQRTVKKPSVGGPITATVVGPQGVEVHTDTLSRIKVLPHYDENKRGDENSSLWVRVSSAWAGMEFGAQHVPRVGDEVLLSFEGGDPDRPVVTGRVVNDARLSPWDLPSQHALSGFRSRELGGSSRANHLVMDDTPKEIQTQLSSDHLTSQINLGHITRIPDRSGRKDKRGEGLEVRTDGHAALRAAMGLLVTTYARQGGQGDMLSVTEINHLLEEAIGIGETLAKSAEEAGAQAGEHQKVAQALKHQATAIEGRGELGEFDKPHIAIASPAGIVTATPGSTHVQSGGHTALTTGEDLSVSTGNNFLASVRNAWRVFVHQAGMKLIAAAGQIDIQALSNSINLLAKLEVTATAERIHIKAKQELLLDGGGSYIKLTPDRHEQGTTGSWMAYASTHGLPGPRSVPVDLAPKQVCIDCLLKASKSGAAVVPR